MSDRRKRELKKHQDSASLSSELRRLQELVRRRIQDLETDNSRLQQELERIEAERQTVLIERDEDRKRWQRERDQLVLGFLRKMGKGAFIPDLLETLQEPDSNLTPPDVLAEFKRWVQDLSGQRLSRFPTQAQAPGERITLTPDELTDPEQGFDVGNERPFAEGQEQVTFRVVRQGWRLGTQILHPARLTSFGVNECPTTKDDEGA